VALALVALALVAREPVVEEPVRAAVPVPLHHRVKALQA
jgi:hypothetical protein